MADYIIKEYKLEFDGKNYIINDHFIGDFTSIQSPKQSLGIVLNENDEVLLVRGDKDFWTLPGGTIEPGETPQQTLIREVYEESAVVIDPQSIKPFSYSISHRIVGDELQYDGTGLRYLARVAQVDKFVKDPGGNMKFRKFVRIEDLDKELGWKETREIIKKLLIDILTSQSVI